MRRIIIEDAASAPEAAPGPEVKAPAVDLQDCLLIAGVVFFEAAALVIWWPSALILAGIFCFVFVALIQRTNGTPKP